MASITRQYNRGLVTRFEYKRAITDNVLHIADDSRLNMDDFNLKDELGLVKSFYHIEEMLNTKSGALAIIDMLCQERDYWRECYEEQYYNDDRF